jgi:hypothetical protein
MRGLGSFLLVGVWELCMLKSRGLFGLVVRGFLSSVWLTRG